MRCRACNNVIKGSRAKISVAPNDPKHELYTGLVFEEEEDLCKECIADIRESYLDYSFDPDARAEELRLYLNKNDDGDYYIIETILEEGKIGVEE
jgi:hypothetical protein